MAFMDFAPSLTGGVIGAGTAILAGQVANKNAERREERNRQADEQRERLRDIRPLIDEAACSLLELWSVLSGFAYAIPAGDPPTSRRSPTEARDPDPNRFVEVYERLRDVNIRLLNRVESSDTFHAPIGTAVSDAQAAFNAVVYEDPYEPRENRSKNAILKAIGSAQHGLREIQNTARERFAPLGMPGSRYTVILVMTVKARGARTDELLASLRKDPARHAKVVGPDKDGRVTVRDQEAAPGEARARLIASLDAADHDWKDYLDLPEAPTFETDAWLRREAAVQSHRPD
jgi:hypothetical protein